MKKYDLERMSIDDLWTLHEQICSVLVKKIEERERGLQRRLDDLSRNFGGEPAGNLPRQPSPKVEPKFQNPEDRSMTWSGRGKQPRWLKQLLASGRAIEDFRIGAPAETIPPGEERNAPSKRVR
jgi:DNA-binding protein H-NS